MAVTSTMPASPENNSVATPPPEGFTNNAYVKDLVSNGDAVSDKNANSKMPKLDETIEPTIDFDDLLPHIGEFGRYQKILFLCMIPFAFFVAFVYFSQIFITLVPDEHWCNVPELSDLSLEER